MTKTIPTFDSNNKFTGSVAQNLPVAPKMAAPLNKRALLTAVHQAGRGTNEVTLDDLLAAYDTALTEHVAMEERNRVIQAENEAREQEKARREELARERAAAEDAFWETFVFTPGMTIPGSFRACKELPIGTIIKTVLASGYVGRRFVKTDGAAWALLLDQHGTNADDDTIVALAETAVKERRLNISPGPMLDPDNLTAHNQPAT